MIQIQIPPYHLLLYDLGQTPRNNTGHSLSVFLRLDTVSFKPDNSPYHACFREEGMVAT